ncbi:MAG TPA: PH domain-containing protein [Rugosimonospora sp.]|nr:PH domain-containing protein [Rugosimonospora sp.]
MSGEPSGVTGVPEVVSARPRKATRVAWVLAGVVVVIFAAIATALHGRTEGGQGVFHTSDQVAMIGLGLLAGAGILMFTRPRVEADARHIRIRNIVGGYDLPWEVVRAVTFHKGSPWASLELQDDDVVAVMAVQAADKMYAVEAVRGLRALLAAHQAGGVARGAAPPRSLD